jgi:hypothetical protein
MTYYRVRIDVIVESTDPVAAADDVNQLLDTIPEPDPPIVSVYRAPAVDKVHRGSGDDQWIVVPSDDQLST